MNPFSLFFESIGKVPELRSAMTASYLADAILALIFVLLLIIVANAIMYDRGRVDNSWKRRRIAFFAIGFATLLCSVALNYFLYFSKIIVPAFRTKYLTTLLLAAFVATLIYFVVSFVIIKISPKDSKLASIFPPKK